MARYYRRYRKYSRRHGKHWSTRLVNFSGAQSAAPQANYVVYQNLAQNPAQDVDTVSQLFTVKNINCQVELEGEIQIENLQAYIMYVPQGYVPTGAPSAYEALPYDHPEWIMVHRFYGSPSVEGASITPGFPPLRLSSRLSRKLDTGDRVILLILGTNTNSGTGSKELYYRGLVKFNTKAN